MIGGLISFPILRLVYTGRISIPILRPSSPSCLRAELADLWSLNGNTILTGASFTLHAHVEIGSQETLLVTKLLMVDCSSWAGYWSRENVCVRRLHSRWNSCHADDTLKARSSIVFSNDFLYLTSTWLLQCSNNPVSVGFLYTLVSRRPLHFLISVPRKGSLPCSPSSMVKLTDGWLSFREH